MRTNNSGSKLLYKIVEDAREKEVFFPNSLRIVQGFNFHRVESLVLND